MADERSGMYSKQREKSIVAHGGSLHLPDASLKNVTLERQQSAVKEVLDKELEYKVKNNYRRRLSVRDQLLKLQDDIKHVKYLDGEKRGVPKDQWDNTVDGAKERKLRVAALYGKGRKIRSAQVNIMSKSSTDLSKLSDVANSRDHVRSVKNTLSPPTSQEWKGLMRNQSKSGQDHAKMPISGRTTSSRKGKKNREVILPKLDCNANTVDRKKRDFVAGYLHSRRRSQSLSDLTNLRITLPPLQSPYSSDEDSGDDLIEAAEKVVMTAR